MLANRSIPDSVIIPELAYRDVREAVAWLCRVFGFRERLQIGDHRAQLTFGGGAIAVTEGDPARATCQHAVLVRVDDVNAHCARAREAGAEIVCEPADYPYGERQYSVRDPGGHVWTFSQSLADVDPSDWGGSLLDGA